MRMRMICLALLLFVALAGCRPSSGGLQIAGSTSVQPLVEVLAEAFREQSRLPVRIQGGGSTAGIQAVLSGVADLGAVSRALHAEEARRGLVAHTIAWDVLAIVVHPLNVIDNLTSAQLKEIFSGRSTDWSHLGGQPGPIRVVTREAGSGSREAFREQVGQITPRALVQGSSGAIRLVVAGDRLAIGYVSPGVLRLGGLRVLRIDGHLPGSAGYPLRRPLSLVTLGQPGKNARAFLQFLLGPEGRALIRKEGFLPANASAASN